MVILAKNQAQITKTIDFIEIRKIIFNYKLTRAINE